MAKATSTEKAAARSASRPAAHRGDVQLGGVAPAGHSVALDALRFRAMMRETRVDADEEGALRLVTKLPPLPGWLDVEIRQYLGRVRAHDRTDAPVLDFERSDVLSDLLVRQCVAHLMVTR